MSAAEQPQPDWLDVSGLSDGSAPHGDVEAQLLPLLERLRQRYPQLPRDEKAHAAVCAQLARKVRAWAEGPDRSLPALVSQLSLHTLKGLGGANQLWPRLFVAAPPAQAAVGAIDMANVARGALRQRLLALWQGYFQGRPETLEWIIAAVDAARPRSLGDLHHVILRWDPGFLPLDAFNLGWGRYFAFDARATAPAAPDWTAFWEKEPDSCYGERYPRSIQEFLAGFFSDLAARAPDARILDVGAGKFAASLVARQASAGFDIIGIDVAQSPPPPPASRIHALRVSAEALSFPAGSFVSAVSVNGIEYANFGQALLELYRVLRPGARAALVLHHADSAVLAKARQFLQLLEDAPILETLALAWHSIDSGSPVARREASKSSQHLHARTARSGGAAFFAATWDGVSAALRAGAHQRDSALALIGSAENVLRWTLRKSRFLIERVARVAPGRDVLLATLQQAGFEVAQLQELPPDEAAAPGPVGWGAVLRVPQRA